MSHPCEEKEGQMETMNHTVLTDPIYDTFYNPPYVHDIIKATHCDCAIEYKVRRHKTQDYYRVFRLPHKCNDCIGREQLFLSMQETTHETLDSPLLGVHQCSHVLSMLYPDDIHADMPF